jgi:hypothetical protein
LQPVERHYFGQVFTDAAQAAESLSLPEDDLTFWHQQANPMAPGCLINHPEFYAGGEQVVAVGSVPGDA